MILVLCSIDMMFVGVDAVVVAGAIPAAACCGLGCSRLFVALAAILVVSAAAALVVVLVS